ncbi:MAG: Omp28-related outer membrane protein [Bacteroidota bacterium]
MKKLCFVSSVILFLGLSSCTEDIVNPYPYQPSLELDTTLYPGNWADYVANEWPTFSQNTNTNRNVLIEDFTGHKCVFCPAAADLAHALHEDNPTRVFTASIHAGPDGIGDFQIVSPPDYPTDFTNQQGVDIGLYFGVNDPGFPGNPRGPVNRINSGGAIFQSPASWTSLTNSLLSNNVLKVNIQSKLNYYDATRGAFLHAEVEKLDNNLGDLGIVVYMIEDSLVGDQKMSDNTHNSSYIHRDIMRGCVDGLTWGRTLTDNMLNSGKYYVNYSFVVPDQLDGNYNPDNMHILIYVYDKTTLEIYQVIKQKIVG